MYTSYDMYRQGKAKRARNLPDGNSQPKLDSIFHDFLSLFISYCVQFALLSQKVTQTFPRADLVHKPKPRGWNLLYWSDWPKHTIVYSFSHKQVIKLHTWHRVSCLVNVSEMLALNLIAQFLRFPTAVLNPLLYFKMFNIYWAICC